MLSYSSTKTLLTLLYRNHILPHVYNMYYVTNTIGKHALTHVYIMDREHYIYIGIRRAVEEKHRAYTRCGNQKNSVHACGKKKRAVVIVVYDG